MAQRVKNIKIQLRIYKSYFKTLYSPLIKTNLLLLSLLLFCTVNRYPTDEYIVKLLLSWKMKYFYLVVIKNLSQCLWEAFNIKLWVSLGIYTSFLSHDSVFCTSVALSLSLKLSAELWKYSCPSGPSDKLRVSLEKIQLNNFSLNKMSMWGTWYKIPRSINWQSQHWWIRWFWDINIPVFIFHSTSGIASRGPSIKGNKYGFRSPTDLCLKTISFTTSLVFEFVQISLDSVYLLAKWMSEEWCLIFRKMSKSNSKVIPDI